MISLPAESNLRRDVDFGTSESERDSEVGTRSRTVIVDARASGHRVEMAADDDDVRAIAAARRRDHVRRRTAGLRAVHDHLDQHRCDVCKQRLADVRDDGEHRHWRQRVAARLARDQTRSIVGRLHHEHDTLCAGSASERRNSLHRAPRRIVRQRSLNQRNVDIGSIVGRIAAVVRNRRQRTAHAAADRVRDDLKLRRLEKRNLNRRRQFEHRRHNLIRLSNEFLNLYIIINS